MSTSLAKIKNQIAKLQKQAATIETGIVARIKAEITKHGLTPEQLFGGSSTAGSVGSVQKPKATAKARAAKSAKFADRSGNTWGGMGKRPQWIRDALEAGKALEDFLVAGKKAAPAGAKPAVKAAAVKVNVAKKGAPKKRAAAKKVAPAKAAASATAKRPVKVAAKKASAKKPAKTRSAAATADSAQAPEA